MNKIYWIKTALLGLLVWGTAGSLQAQCIANAGPDRNVCGNACETLGEDTTQVGLVYQWNGLGGTATTSLSDPNIAQPLMCPNGNAGDVYIFQFVVNDNINFCSDTDTVVIVQTQPFNVSLGFSDSTICLGDTLRPSVNLNPAGSDYTYQWSVSGGNFQFANTEMEPLLEPDATSTLTLIVTDTVTNCRDNATLLVTVNPLQVVIEPSITVMNPGQRVQFTSSVLDGFPPYTYTWTPDTYLSCTDCPNPEAHPFESINYTLNVVDSRGCRGVADAQVSVDPFFVPNVFTPNGDDINDQLILNYYEYAAGRTYEILIYDRWGVLVFETQDPQVNWDGRDLNNNEVEEGVYYMYVRINGDPAISDEQKQKAFAINLVR